MSIVRPVAVRPDLLKPTGSSHPSYPTTTPPSRIDTPPTPELTISNAFIGMYEAKAPPPLDLPSRLSLVRSRSGESESQHGSPCVSPSPSTSASSISSSLLPPSLSETDSRQLNNGRYTPTHDVMWRRPTFAACASRLQSKKRKSPRSPQSHLTLSSLHLNPLVGSRTVLKAHRFLRRMTYGAKRREGKLMKRRSLKTLMKRALGGRSLGFKEMLKV
ncbi:hypothetical protein BDZ97DRAFT_1762339 [Flammula alnicola]|nr:hypothetical protein BDZ97DRAFT_1762339 [Flammula alnicola]